MPTKLQLKKAWDKTIKKWSKPNLDVFGYISAENCGLCDLFRTDIDNIQNCLGCPINTKNRRNHYCKSFSPYNKLLNMNYDNDLNSDKVEALRKKALAWLLKLRAKTEVK